MDYGTIEIESIVDWKVVVDYKRRSRIVAV